MLGKRIKSIWREPYYEITVFAILFTTFLFTVPNMQMLGKSNLLYYVLPYSAFGFQSRLVVGSVVSFFADYITGKTIYAMMIIITVLFILAVSFVVGRIMRLAVGRNENSAEMLMILFVACPVSIQYLFTYNNLGRFDLFLILLTAIILYCIHREKAKWAVPALCLFAMIISFNFAFLYMPVIAIIMINEYMVAKRSRSGFLIFAVSCMAVAVSFAYFKIFPPAPAFGSLEELKAYLAGRTDVRGEEFIVFYDVCRPLADTYSRGADKAFVWFYDLLCSYGSFALLSVGPAFAFFSFFWFKALRNTPQKNKKLFYLLCLISPAGGLPMFLTIDWDRWIPTLFISQMMLVMYLFAVSDTGTVDTLHKAQGFFSRHSLFALLCIVYLSSSIFFNRYSIYSPVMLKHIDTFFSIQ